MCTFLFLLTTLVAVICEELILVQTVFRHGDRAPIGGSTSLESEAYYYRGKAHLTNKGLRQSQQLGVSLRRRYAETGFLDVRYLPSEVYIQSSASERCLMTASAAASAIFNLTEFGHPTVVPIFTEPKQRDHICYPRLHCPFVIDEMMRILGVSNRSMSLEDILGKLYEREVKLRNFTHVVGDRLKLFEPLFLEHDSGLAVPQWFSDDARKEADHLLDLTIEFLSGTGTFRNPNWILTRSGKLLFTILKNQRLAAENALNGKKFFGFSTHDVVISALLESMGVLKVALAPQGRPDFVAAIVFELWKNGTQCYVKVLYRRSTQYSNFTNLISSIDGCEGAEACNIEVFERSLQAFQTEHPELLCEEESTGDGLVSNSVIFSGNDPANNSGFTTLTVCFMVSTALFAVLFFASLVLVVPHRMTPELKLDPVRSQS